MLTERIIRLAKLSEQSQLLEHHRKIASELEIEREYRALFPQTVDITTLLAHDCLLELPKAIIELIVEYCGFCWLPEGNVSEDEVFEKLLAL